MMELSSPPNNNHAAQPRIGLARQRPGYHCPILADDCDLASLTQLVPLRDEELHDETAYVWLDDDGSEAVRWTYGNFYSYVSAVEDVLRGALDLSPDALQRARVALRGRDEADVAVFGDASQQLQRPRAILMLAPGLEFIGAFMACLSTGVIAVPVYPPSPGRLVSDLGKMARVIKDSGAQVVVTTKSLHRLLKLGTFRKRMFNALDGGLLPAVQWLYCPPASTGFRYTRKQAVEVHTPSRSDVAFLQYTSGTTGDPKGVVITHAMMIHNAVLQSSYIRADMPARIEREVFVSWLPQYHDMGLAMYIAAFMVPLQVVCMSPISFIRRPLLWLEAISSYRGTFTTAPSFGYSLVLAKSTPEERAQLDLSCLDKAMVAAEPIRKRTVEEFAAAFGVPETLFFPAYGLAENVVMVAAVRPEPDGIFLACDSAVLQEKKCVALVPPEEQHDRSVEHISICGVGNVHSSFEIVDDKTCERKGPGEIGEIWVRATESTSLGYWQRRELSRRAFHAQLASADAPPGRFLRTGDLGFVYGPDHALYVSGRLSDLLIFRGRNLFPYDIEATCEAANSMVRPGCTVAFAVEEADESRLAIWCEVRSRNKAPLEDIRRDVCAAVLSSEQVEVKHFLISQPHSVPKTTSGKLKRKAAAQMFTSSADPMQLPGVLLSWTAGEVRVARQAAPLDPLSKRICSMLELPETLDPQLRLPDVGLDSVRLVRVQAKLENVFSLSLGIDDLFSLTVGDLLKQAQENMPDESKSEDEAEQEHEDDDLPSLNGDAELTISQLHPSRGSTPMLKQSSMSDVVMEVKAPTTTHASPRMTMPRRAALSLLQLIGMVWLCVAIAAPGVFTYWLADHIVSLSSVHAADLLWLAPLCYLVFGLALCVVVLVHKWLLVGRARPGLYRHASTFAVLRWLVDRLVSISSPLFINQLAGTALYTCWLRLLGARIALTSRVFSTAVSAVDADLLSIGQHTVIEADAALQPAVVTPSSVALSHVLIGSHSVVGTRSVLQGGAMVSSGVEVAPNTAVAAHSSVTHEPRSADDPRHASPLLVALWSVFAGVLVPGLCSTIAGILAYAVLRALADSALPHLNDMYAQAVSADHVRAMVVLVVVLHPMTLPAVLFAGGVQLHVVVEELYEHDELLPLLGIAATAVVVHGYALMALTVGVKWLLAGFTRVNSPLTFDFESSFGLRLWATDKALLYTHERFSSLLLGSHVYTLYLRCLGCAIGRGVLFGMSLPPSCPDLVQIGDNTFVGDGHILRTARIRVDSPSWVSPIEIGDRALIGMNSTLLGGAVVGRAAVVGASSLVDAESVVDDGVVAIGTPVRALYQAGDSVKQPGPELRYWLLLAYSVLAPGFVVFTLLLSFVPAGYLAGRVRAETGSGDAGEVPDAFAAGVMHVLAGIALMVLSVLCKWIVLLERYQEGSDYPLTSSFFARRTLCVQLQWLSVRLFGDALLGTPLYNVYLCALGARVSLSAMVLTPFVTEPDLLTVGECAVVEPHALVFGHYVMRQRIFLNRASIGDEAKLGFRSVIFPAVGNVHIGALSEIEPLSMLMRTTVDSETVMGGVPASVVENVLPAAFEREARFGVQTRLIKAETKLASSRLSDASAASSAATQPEWGSANYTSVAQLVNRLVRTQAVLEKCASTRGGQISYARLRRVAQSTAQSDGESVGVAIGSAPDNRSLVHVDLGDEAWSSEAVLRTRGLSRLHMATDGPKPAVTPLVSDAMSGLDSVGPDLVVHHRITAGAQFFDLLSESDVHSSAGAISPLVFAASALLGALSRVQFPEEHELRGAELHFLHPVLAAGTCVTELFVSYQEPDVVETVTRCAGQTVLYAKLHLVPVVAQPLIARLEKTRSIRFLSLPHSGISRSASLGAYGGSLWKARVWKSECQEQDGLNFVPAAAGGELHSVPQLWEALREAGAREPMGALLQSAGLTALLSAWRIAPSDVLMHVSELCLANAGGVLLSRAGRQLGPGEATAVVEMLDGARASIRALESEAVVVPVPNANHVAATALSGGVAERALRDAAEIAASGPERRELVRVFVDVLSLELLGLVGARLEHVFPRHTTLSSHVLAWLAPEMAVQAVSHLRSATWLPVMQQVCAWTQPEEGLDVVRRALGSLAQSRRRHVRSLLAPAARAKDSRVHRALGEYGLVTVFDVREAEASLPSLEERDAPGLPVAAPWDPVVSAFELLCVLQIAGKAESELDDGERMALAVLSALHEFDAAVLRAVQESGEEAEALHDLAADYAHLHAAAALLMTARHSAWMRRDDELLRKKQGGALLDSDRFALVAVMRLLQRLNVVRLPQADVLDRFRMRHDDVQELWWMAERQLQGEEPLTCLWGEE